MLCSGAMTVLQLRCFSFASPAPRSTPQPVQQHRRGRMLPTLSVAKGHKALAPAPMLTLSPQPPPQQFPRTTWSSFLQSPLMFRKDGQASREEWERESFMPFLRFYRRPYVTIVDEKFRQKSPTYMRLAIENLTAQQQQQQQDDDEDSELEDGAHNARGAPRGHRPRGWVPLGRNGRGQDEEDGLGKPKFSIPKFEGGADVEEYLTWELKIEKLWSLHPHYSEDRKIKLALLNLMVMHCVGGILWQGVKTVDEYYMEMEMLMQRGRVRESLEMTMQRFLNGLKYDVKGIVRHYTYTNMNQLLHHAREAESQLAEEAKVKGRATGAGSFTPCAPSTAPAPSTRCAPYSTPPSKPVSNVSNAKKSESSSSTSGSSMSTARNRDMLCHTCGGKGHFKRDCPNRKVMIINEDNEYETGDDVDPNAPDDDDYDTDGEVAYPSDARTIVVSQRALNVLPSASTRCNLFQTKALVGPDKACKVIIDGGSCRNLASKELCTKLKLKYLPHPHPYYIQWLSDNGEMKESHVGGLMGHFGREKTLLMLADHFYWPKMRRDVDRYVKRCITCNKSKSKLSLTAVHSTTELCPFEVVYGFKPITPLDLLPLPIHERVNMEASKRADFVKKIHVKTKDLIEKKGKSNAARMNKKCKEMLFKPGDLVWVHFRKDMFPKRKSKLKPRGAGPYKVLAKINDNAYSIELPEDEFGVSNSFNVADLTPYDGEDLGASGYEEEASIARGGEEQLDVKMDVKLDMELDMKISHGRARRSGRNARGEEEVQGPPVRRAHAGPLARRRSQPPPTGGLHPETNFAACRPLIGPRPTAVHTIDDPYPVCLDRSIRVGFTCIFRPKLVPDAYIVPWTTP
ncbi:hypothetical protein QYE76_024505 [Lolium multiflorum]|uniref:CCHC-type domain-containing protein n=1 Tax=Lolium multiflorum TaxID=4521 RepID=A0AAD8RGS7_LOLMU|nr:hypothetical protein QYE76_024505 [Lolium multiflorum]